MNLEELFAGHPLMSQLLKSPVYYDDISWGIKKGMSPFELIRIYEEYFEETGQQTIGGKGNTIRLRKWQ